jgi:N-acetylhexosamine 1-kinase
MKELIQTVLKDFFVEVKDFKYKTLHDGLINNTFKVETNEGIFVLQKMNQKVFPNIKALLNNKIKTTNFFNKINFKTVSFLPNKKGEFYSVFNDEIWQISNYIPSVVTDKIVSEEQANEVGKYLASFHKALLEFPISELQYTIPDFHNSIKRFDDFKNSVKTASPERLAEAKESTSYLTTNFYKIKKVAIDINEGIIPLRVVHNDTKVGNMLFNNEGKVISIIDFDTIMPGSIFHDIGDAMRTGSNTSNEEEKDLSKVCFDVVIYDSFMKGYVEEAKDFMTIEESKNIHLSLPLILFEQACRFLADYLNNDVYYAISYENQNLVRAKTQIKLFDSVMKL